MLTRKHGQEFYCPPARLLSCARIDSIPNFQHAVRSAHGSLDHINCKLAMASGPLPLPAGKKWHAFASHSKRAGDKTPDLVRSIKSTLGAKGFKHPHDAIFLPNGDFVVATWSPGRIGYFRKL